jgi:eukaryotic-like serine/threonine-protein kinase
LYPFPPEAYIIDAYRCLKSVSSIDFLEVAMDLKPVSWLKVAPTLVARLRTFLWLLYRPPARNRGLAVLEEDKAPTSQTTILDGGADSIPSYQDRHLGPYVLEKCIGSGGMGVIWRARDSRLGRSVAVKLLPPELAQDHSYKARFLQEARLIANLDHPNICSIYEIGETDEHCLYIVMPCYEGETLDQAIAKGPLSISQIIEIGIQIATGLSRAHEKGIVHRDIKPSNLMLTRDGTLKILDFGIAKLTDNYNLTRTGAVVGTPAYMAPEQMTGTEVDKRADLWSLGIVLYEMLTGRRPLNAANAIALREAILHAEIVPANRLRPEAPRLLVQLVQSLLRRDSAARIQSADSALALLRALEGGTRKPFIRSFFAYPWPMRRWAILVLCGLAMTSALLIARVETSPSADSLPPRAPRPVSKRPAIVVLGLRNLSENRSQGWLGAALAEMLATELQTGATLRVVSSEESDLARQTLNLESTSRLTQEHAGRLHALVGADLALEGTYLPLGRDDDRQIRLDLRIVTLPQGEVLASIAEIGPTDRLFDLVARTGSKLRSALGFSTLTTDDRLKTRGLLPSTPEAIRLYSQGLILLRSFDPTGARDLLVRAETLEPESAVINYALSEVWTVLGHDAEASRAALKALQVRDSLPQETQIAIEAHFYKTKKEWERAIEAYRALQALVPDELRYGLELADMLSMAGRGQEALAVLERLHDQQPPADPRVDFTEAVVAWRVTDYKRLDEASWRAVEKGRRLGAEMIVARGLVYRAHLATIRGRAQEAIQILQQVQTLALRTGDRFTLWRAEGNLGFALQGQGHLEEAEQAHERALIIAKQLGTVLGIANELFSLGEINKELGNYKKATEFIEESLSSFRALDYRIWEARVEASLASIYLVEGNLTASRSLLEESLSISQLLSGSEYEVRAILGLSTLEKLEGNSTAAAQLLEGVLPKLSTLHHPGLAAETLSRSADLLMDVGNPALARLRLLQAEATARRSLDRLTIGRVLGTRTRLAFKAGDLAGAAEAAEAQLRLARETHAVPMISEALSNLARIAQTEGEFRRARGLLGEALRSSSAIGDQLACAAISVDLARTHLEAGDFGAALDLAQGAAAWYRDHQIPGGEAVARALKAESQLRMGRSRPQ